MQAQQLLSAIDKVALAESLATSAWGTGTLQASHTKNMYNAEAWKNANILVLGSLDVYGLGYLKRTPTYSEQKVLCAQPAPQSNAREPYRPLHSVCSERIPMVVLIIEPTTTVYM